MNWSWLNRKRSKINIEACMQVGQRIFLNDIPITCVHVDNGKFIFSVDYIFKVASYDQIKSTLQTLKTTGKIDGIEVIPKYIAQSVDFFFIPSEYQITGQNRYAAPEENPVQFDWFKNGNFTRVKSYMGLETNYWEKGETCSWWLSNDEIDCSKRAVRVTPVGELASTDKTYKYLGIPVFFQIT